MEQTILADINRLFDDQLRELILSKGQNSQIFTKSAYLDMIEKVKISKNKVSNKKPEDYQRLRRFDIVSIGEEERLIVPASGGNVMRFYVHTEEIFQILHSTHVSIGHGGRNQMVNVLKLRYKNITREMIVTYLNLCVTCERKHSVSKKNLVARPSLSSVINARCHVDLIDMQSQEDNQYNFILVYQDSLTKFLQLRSLKSDDPKEVAYVLVDIFTIFGAPNVLESGIGREFASKVVKEFSVIWPDLKMVHGKPSQRSLEQANQDIVAMLNSWLEDNHTTKWSEGLRFVQLMKNRSHHAGINSNPYEAMFSTKLKIGLKSYLPQQPLVDINSEEDLETILNDKDEIKSKVPEIVQNTAMKEEHPAQAPGPSQISHHLFILNVQHDNAIKIETDPSLYDSQEAQRSCNLMHQEPAADKEQF
ncbi:hypothetical protein QYM36_010414 [Artemia franciscana]|uniref:Integrase catalytic domain-containing protein n=1 Tax=Artemia franciscana TaxID=6661 RepID=A0AA88HXH2_ARTSF|nr:hypothetical protein QYM36_010414 [Artemia franciscana]